MKELDPNAFEKARKEHAEKKWVIGQRAVYKDGFKDGVMWIMKEIEKRKMLDKNGNEP